MKTVKRTLIRDSKNKTEWVNTDEAIDYVEKKTGTKVPDGAAELFRAYEKLLNDAYRDGYEDGKEAAQG